MKPSPMAELIPFVLLLGLMWFLLIRPQQARLRKQRELVSSIEVGQRVLTAGGLIGTVRVLTDDELLLEVSPGVEVRLIRAAITRRLDDDGLDDGGLGDAGSDAGDGLPGQDAPGHDPGDASERG
ncbi:MAG: preprotein translocase subunit YajC [Actinomycetota bacterium]|nr:preprotein translocase subunit YajC [Actinomycetota bacterium]